MASSIPYNNDVDMTPDDNLSNQTYDVQINDDSSQGSTPSVDPIPVSDTSSRIIDNWVKDLTPTGGEEGDKYNDTPPTEKSPIPEPVYKTVIRKVRESIKDYSQSYLEELYNNGAKFYVIYTDGTEDEVSYTEIHDPHQIQTGTYINEAQQIAEATNQHFWHDDNGAHVTDVEQDDWKTAANVNFNDLSDSKPYHNILMNSLGILLRRALYNLVSISKSAVTFYDGLGNNLSNVRASFGSAGATFRENGKTKATITTQGLSIYDNDGSVSGNNETPGSKLAFIGIDDSGKPYTRIGKSTKGYIEIGTNGDDNSYIDMYNADVLLCHIGYDVGINSEGNTSNAPYYDFGIRGILNQEFTRIGSEQRKFYVGDVGVYNGSVYRCIKNHTMLKNYALFNGCWEPISVVIGNYSSVIGNNNEAIGYSSFAQGRYCVASGGYSQAEGRGSQASGWFSHAEGELTHASGMSCHAEGYQTVASGGYSHTEGNSVIASGLASHAEGYYVEATGDYGSHAEGYYTDATALYSHAEGNTTKATATGSHAEGYYCEASGEYSHAEGSSSHAIGNNSHAGGEISVAYGSASFAHGFHVSTYSNSNYQFVCGKYNKTQSSDIFQIGNGTSGSTANAFRVTTSNTAYMGSTQVTSDKRIKTDLGALDISEATEFIKSLIPHKYEKFGRKELGFFAQDVEQDPNYGDILVEQYEDHGYEDFRSLSYDGMIAPIVSVEQDLISRVEQLEAENKELKLQNEKLNKRLGDIERILANLNS